MIRLELPLALAVAGQPDTRLLACGRDNCGRSAATAGIALLRPLCAG